MPVGELIVSFFGSGHHASVSAEYEPNEGTCGNERLPVPGQ